MNNHFLLLWVDRADLLVLLIIFFKALRMIGSICSYMWTTKSSTEQLSSSNSTLEPFSELPSASLSLLDNFYDESFPISPSIDYYFLDARWILTLFPAFFHKDFFNELGCL